MVTFFSFFNHIKICIKVSCFCISCTINSWKHFILFITSPISTCNRCKFKCFYRFCTHKVWTCTKVNIFTLFIEWNNSIFWKVIYKFNFIWFFSFFHIFYSFCSWKFKFFKWKIFFNNSFHFFFNSCKFFWCKWCRSIKVIIETFSNSRSYCKFCFWVKSFYSLSHNMRCCMTESSFSFFIIKCTNTYFWIFIYNKTKVLCFTINYSTASISCKSFAYTFCNIKYGNCIFIFFYNSVFKCNLNHYYISFQIQKISNKKTPIP